MKRPSKKLTFDFFNYKWKRVSNWACETEDIYRRWYLKRYGYQTLQPLKKFLKDKHRILEAGCGLARDSKMFAELNSKAEIVAMDQSPSALKVARLTLRPFQNCKVVRADITRFSYGELFDFISCDQVLHHTPDPTQTLRHLYSHLTLGGVLNFFVCRKKNRYRDLVDDLIMDRARTMTPEQLWKFAETITHFGRVLYELGIKNVRFDGREYEDIQRFVHNQVFRCWYNPDIGFDLSVSSNYDWFSGNPRFNAEEVKKMMECGLGPHEVLSFYEDDASISVSTRKLNAVR